MQYVQVRDTDIIGAVRALPLSFSLEDGSTICGFNGLTDLELLAYGWYRVIELAPVFDPNYEQVGGATLSLKGSVVERSYHLSSILASEYLVSQRLTAFAKEKDIDIQEVAILLVSTNTIWRQEAHIFKDLYEQTWEAFYSYTGATWKDLEATLPALIWE